MYKYLFWGVFGLFILFGFLSFAISDSYQKSLRARWHFNLGEYETAHQLAKEAYVLDPYNKMAFGVKKQSELSLRFKNYIEESDDYLLQIKTIVEKPDIQTDDKIRVKFMCEIMIQKFEKFRETVVTDKELVREAKERYQKFKTIYESVY